jgi:predicted nucleic acid-binding protein
MSFVLDTSLVSELIKRTPDANVMAWLGAQDEDALFLSVITLGEIQKGISRLPPGARRDQLHSWLTHDLVRRFRTRILPVTDDVALTWGARQGEAERSGHTLPVVDCLIAATALVNKCSVVTRNVEHMRRCGASVVNPWEPASP